MTYATQVSPYLRGQFQEEEPSIAHALQQRW